MIGVPAPGPARAASPASIEAEVIRLTNIERQKVGAPPLRANPTITAIAEKYAVLMTNFTGAQLAVNNAQASHHLDGSDGAGRLAAGGYAPAGTFAWAENTAWGFPDANSAVQFWVHHPGHRENLLSTKVTEIGVGVAFTAAGETRFCQDFARPPGQ